MEVSQAALGNRLSFQPVSYQGRSLQTPLYYGLRGGYFFTRHLGAEAEFVHLKVFADTGRSVAVRGIRLGRSFQTTVPLRHFVQRFAISHGVNLLLFNLVGRVQASPRHPEGHPPWVFFGRLGLGPTFPHTESTIEGLSQEQYEVGPAVFQGAAGAEVLLAKGLYALAEYKYTRTRPRGQISEGTAETLLQSHHLVGGLTFHWGRPKD